MSAETKSSVALITIDCLRADHVGCYGYDRPTTPNIDAFAAGATLFEHSYANCPGTRWALQSLHTGVYTNQVKGIGIPSEATALAAYFRDHGYATGGFANNGFLTREYNYDDGFDEFHDVTDFSRQRHPIERLGHWVNDTLANEQLRTRVLEPLHTALRSARGSASDGFRPRVTDEEVCNEAIEWIRTQQESNRPFFVWIHLMDAHTPYARWDEHLRALRGDTDTEHVIIPVDDITVGENPPQKVIDAYDAGIRSADEQVGRVLNAVGGETVAALTGDHGEEFGQFGTFHSASTYSSMTQVPLIVRSSKLAEGVEKSLPAQHLDIAPTLAEATDHTALEAWVGRPLGTTDRDSDDSIVFCLGEGQSAVRAGNWKLIRENGSEKLYHIPDGGIEKDNVSHEHPARWAELSELLDDRLEWMTGHQVGTGRADLSVDGSEVSDEVRDNLEELGYLDT